VAVVVGALTLLVFLPALACGFVHIDDPQTVPRYAAILRGLTWDGARIAFGDQFFGHWVPLTVLSLMLDWQLWGRVAFGHHLTSLLLHAVNAGLAFLVLRLIGLASGRAEGSAAARAAAAALLFAIHPLRVEPVLWLTGRKDLLSACGALLALHSYLRWRDRPTRGRWLATTAALAAALLGKATAMVVPALMLLLDAWPLGRAASPSEGRGSLRELLARWRPLVVEKLPWLAMSAAAAAVALVSARASAAMAELESVAPGSRLATAAVGYATYLRQTVWPRDLAAFYPLPREGWPPATVAIAAGVFVACTAGALLAARRMPFLAVGWLWWVACLLPVSGLLQAGEQASADRYTYLAAVGLAMAVVWSVAGVAGAARWTRVVAVGALAAVLVACAVATREQIATWRDSESVFRRMIAVTHDNHFGHLNLANVLAERGALPEAIAEYRRAVALRPDLALGWTGLGAALRRQGDEVGAAAALERALRTEPRLAAAHLQLAALYEEQGALGPAIGHLARVISLEPHHAQAWQGLASILGRPGAARQGLPFVVAVARAEPGSAELRDLVALLRRQAGAAGAPPDVPPTARTPLAPDRP
jgi:tetratricopeptide (TPR) repeat protein